MGMKLTWDSLGCPYSHMAEEFSYGFPYSYVAEGFSYLGSVAFKKELMEQHTHTPTTTTTTCFPSPPRWFSRNTIEYEKRKGNCCFLMSFPSATSPSG